MRENVQEQVLSPPWLEPATDALRALATGGDATTALAGAMDADPHRTGLFLCLGLAELGEGEKVRASWLSTAFGELTVSEPVSRGQRALWVAAARGDFGAAGSVFVVHRLTNALDNAHGEPAACAEAGPTIPADVLRLLTRGNTTAAGEPAGTLMTLIRRDLGADPGTGLPRVARQAITPNARTQEPEPPVPPQEPRQTLTEVIPPSIRSALAERPRRRWVTALGPILISAVVTALLILAIVFLMP